MVWGSATILIVNAVNFEDLKRVPIMKIHDAKSFIKSTKLVASTIKLKKNSVRNWRINLTYAQNKFRLTRKWNRKL